MKLQFTLRVLAAVLSFCLPAHAQLGDNNASKKFLAEKCATSAGGTSAQYEDYAARLAKTMSQYSSQDQNEIMGLHNPGGGGTTGGDTSGGGATGGGTSAGGGTSGGGDDDDEDDDGGDSSGDDGDDESGDGGDSSNGWGGGGGGGSWWGSRVSDDGLTNGLVFAGTTGKKATANVAFAPAIVEEITPASFYSNSEKLSASILTGTLSQAYSPLGEPLLRSENLAPKGSGKIEFKNGELSFLSHSKEKGAGTEK